MKRFFSIIAILILTIVIGWAVFASSASAITVPHYLGLEGRLTDSSDTALTGTYDITFRIYKALTGGTALWTEIQSDVSVSSGYFSVNLGDTTALDLDFDEQYWVSIEVESDGEMSPRTPINSVGYAYASDIAFAAYATTTAPLSPSAGDLYYDTDNNNIYVYNNVSWEDLAGPSSTLFSITDTAYFGGTATSTFGSDGSLTMASNIISDANNTDDLGGYGSAWKDLYVSSTAYIEDLITKGTPVVDVRAYGATNDNSTDSTAAFQAAIDAAYLNLSNAVGGIVYIPPGMYKLTGTLNVTNHRIHIYGAGKNATFLNFLPTSEGLPLFHFSTGAGSDLYQNSISKLSINSAPSNTVQKIGIQLTDVSEMLIEDVSMLYMNGNSSVGIKVRGHEAISFNRIQISADYPLVISDNPDQSIDIDHLHVQDAYLTGSSTYPIVTIEDGVNLSNVTFDGYQAWVKGGHGLQWIDTSTTQVGFGLTIKNVRWEQSTNASGYFVDIEHNTNLQNLVIDNLYGGLNTNGIKLRKVKWAGIKNYLFTGTSLVALDVNSTTIPLVLENVFLQEGSTSSFGSLTTIMDAGRNNQGGTTYPFAIFDVPKVAGAATNFNRITIASSTPWARFSVHGLSSDTTPTKPLFAIATSTPSATTSVFVVKANGDVGIGTDVPLSVLNVAGTTGLTWANSADSFGLVTIGTGGTSGSSLWLNTPSLNSLYHSGLGIFGTYGTPIRRSVININAYGVKSAGGYGSEFAFSITKDGVLSEAMRIDQNGNIGVSTSTPWAKFSVHSLGNNFDPAQPLFVIATSTPSATTSVLIVDASGNSTFGGNLLPDGNNTRDIGAFGSAWNNLFVSSTSYLGGLSVSSTSNGYTELIPESANYLVIGDAGVTSHTLNANDDLLVSGKLEVNGQTYLDAAVHMRDDSSFNFGNSDDVRMSYRSNVGALYIPTDEANSNSLFISEDADVGTNFSHGNQTNPTVYIQSADATNVDQYLGLAHDQTNGRIGVGVGNITVSSTALVPDVNNLRDLGAYGSAWQNLYVSSTLFASSTVLANGSAGAPSLNFGGAPTSGFYLDSGRPALSVAGTVRWRWAADTLVAMDAGQRMNDDHALAFGVSSDSFIVHRTGQTPDSLIFGLGAESNSITFAQSADVAFDFAHSQTNPTIFIHSANQNVNEYLSFAHDQTNGRIGVGVGNITVSSTALVPDADNLRDLGAYGSTWKDIYASSTIYTNDIQLGFAGDVGTISAVSTITMDTVNNVVLFPDSEQLRFGTGSDASLYYNAQQTPDVLYMGVGADSNGLVVAQRADSGFDFLHALETNPTIFIHSANQNVDEYLSLTHDQTNGRIGVGVGNITVSSTALVPDVNNLRDLGVYDKAWNNIYASSTVYLTDIFASALTNSTQTNTVCYNSVTGEISYISGDACSTSLRKYKENINDYNIDIDKLMELNAVTFNWIDTGKEDFGLIADDVAPIFPELGTYSDEGELMGLNYGKIGVVLLEAFQKIWEIITSYGNQLDMQQSRIEELEDKINILMLNNNLENQDEQFVEEQMEEEMEDPIEEEVEEQVIDDVVQTNVAEDEEPPLLEVAEEQAEEEAEIEIEDPIEELLVEESPADELLVVEELSSEE